MTAFDKLMAFQRDTEGPVPPGQFH